MKTSIIIDRAMKTASDIYFKETRLKELGRISSGEWIKNDSTYQEEFDIKVKENKRLYKNLRKYRDELCYTNEITTDEYKEINIKIAALLDGTYKKIYCK